MKSQIFIARIVGVLFLVQMIAAVISNSIILNPILHSEDLLAEISINSTQVKIAMLFDLLCGAAYVGIAVLLFPILKKHNEPIALWYVGLRIIGFTTLVLSGIFLLTIISLSLEYTQSGLPESSFLQSLGNSILSARGWTKNLGLIIYCLGASLFYYLLFRSGIIARFISLWGLIGVIFLFTEMMLITFGKSLGMILMMPIGLNEIFLGIWLIIKGFNTSAVIVDSET